LEGDVLKAGKRLSESNTAEILTFHLNEDEFVQGLICGGTVDVLVEPVTREDRSTFETLDARRRDGEDTIVATIMAKDNSILSKHLILGEKDLRFERTLEKVESESLTLKQLLRDEIHKAFHRCETRRVGLKSGALILEPVQGTPSLIVFGGGHVSRYVCKTAAVAGFRVTIIDDREQYANPARFPEASRTLALDFASASSTTTVKPSTYIVIVTRGHQYDEEILEWALKTPAKYIGMIGSKRKVFTTYEHLADRGISVEALRSVHAPIGIELGAVTAEEIGVSVVAELIAVRRGEQTPFFSKSVAMQELFVRLEKKYSLS
jgi:xanthine dehydrogenase accessory factor